MYVPVHCLRQMIDILLVRKVHSRIYTCTNLCLSVLARSLQFVACVVFAYRNLVRTADHRSCKSMNAEHLCCTMIGMVLMFPSLISYTDCLFADSIRTCSFSW